MSEGTRLMRDGETHIFIGDVSQIPLQELLSACDDSPLGQLVRMARRLIDAQGENYAAHSSST